MLKRLEKCVKETEVLNSKLVLLIGAPGSGKSQLLSELATSRNCTVMRAGSELGRKLVELPQRQRTLMASTLVRELASTHVADDLLLLDNLELLFDRSLKLDPLDLLKQHAKVRRVVAAWPGEIKNERLVYAEVGHPEYQDYSLDGVVPFELNKIV